MGEVNKMKELTYAEEDFLLECALEKWRDTRDKTDNQFLEKYPESEY